MTELNCGCRRWLVAGSDTITDVYDESIALSKDWVIDHKCEAVTVYRKRFGLKRVYYQKFKEDVPIIDELDEENI